MPAGSERGSAAIGVQGSKVYMVGGMRTLTPGPGGLQDKVTTFTSYDVKSGSWETLPNMPEARDHAGGALIGGTLYVVGGRDRGQVNVRDTVNAYDVSKRRWTERSPMPTPRGGIAAAAIGRKIYTFGGEGNHEPGTNSIFDETEVYDTRTDTWQRLAPMATPQHGTAAAALGNVIYMPGGGSAAGGSPMDVNDVFHPSRIVRWGLDPGCWTPETLGS